MTTIRNQTISLTTSQTGSSAAGSHSDIASQADPSTSPFAALLQRHVDAETGAAKTGSKSASFLNQAAAQTTAQREHETTRTARSDQSRAERATEQTAQHEAAREVAHEAAHEADRSASKPAVRQAGSKTPAKTADKAAKAAKADGTKTASDDADDEASDAKATAATADPLAAWLAALQGGAGAADAASAEAAAVPAAGGKAQAAVRAQGETPLQAVDARDPGLKAEQGGTRQALKADDANGFAALLGGAGRAGDAAGGNALGLAAVRMLGSGGDAAALQTLAQQTALVAEQSGVSGANSIAAPDASAQAAALNSLTGAGAVPTHGTDAPTVAAPVGSPAFAGELADQVQVLVSKASLEAAAAGVHEARLNLNPAEMGPISIRISLDGNQAQVDFAAASGTTRQALQDSMPALASALDGAGLTLSGGGVSQEFAQARHDQAQQPGGSSMSSTLPRGADVDAAGAVQDLTSAVGNWVRRPEGKLDIYA